MSLESENKTKLQAFFTEEYRSLKVYVKSRIRDTANRDAEDIIQDVALKLFTGADRYAPINNVAGFVYKSIKHKIIDIMRSPAHKEPLEVLSDFSDLAGIMNAAGDDKESEQMFVVLKKAIQELKPSYQFIIVSMDLKGISYKEISEKTGIPQGTLMSRRHRALSILYKKINTVN